MTDHQWAAELLQLCQLRLRQLSQEQQALELIRRSLPPRGDPPADRPAALPPPQIIFESGADTAAIEGFNRAIEHIREDRPWVVVNVGGTLMIRGTDGTYRLAQDDAPATLLAFKLAGAKLLYLTGLSEAATDPNDPDEGDIQIRRHLRGLGFPYGLDPVRHRRGLQPPVDFKSEQIDTMIRTEGKKIALIIVANPREADRLASENPEIEVLWIDRGGNGSFQPLPRPNLLHLHRLPRVSHGTALTLKSGQLLPLTESVRKLLISGATPKEALRESSDKLLQGFLAQQVYHEWHLLRREEFNALQAAGRLAELPARLIVFIDVRGLKRVNKVLTHESGNHLLSTFAALAGKYFPQALKMRVGGDELLIEVEGASPEELQTRLAAMEREFRQTPIANALPGKNFFPAGARYAIARTVPAADRLIKELSAVDPLTQPLSLASGEVEVMRVLVENRGDTLPIAVDPQLGQEVEPRRISREERQWIYLAGAATASPVRDKFLKETLAGGQFVETGLAVALRRPDGELDVFDYTPAVNGAPASFQQLEHLQKSGRVIEGVDNFRRAIQQPGHALLGLGRQYRDPYGQIVISLASYPCHDGTTREVLFLGKGGNSVVVLRPDRVVEKRSYLAPEFVKNGAFAVPKEEAAFTTFVNRVLPGFFPKVIQADDRVTLMEPRLGPTLQDLLTPGPDGQPRPLPDMGKGAVADLLQVLHYLESRGVLYLDSIRGNTKLQPPQPATGGPSQEIGAVAERARLKMIDPTLARVAQDSPMIEIWRQIAEEWGVDAEGRVLTPEQFPRMAEIQWKFFSDAVYRLLVAGAPIEWFVNYAYPAGANPVANRIVRERAVNEVGRGKHSSVVDAGLHWIEIGLQQASQEAQHNNLDPEQAVRAFELLLFAPQLLVQLGDQEVPFDNWLETGLKNFNTRRDFALRELLLQLALHLVRTDQLSRAADNYPINLPDQLAPLPDARLAIPLLARVIDSKTVPERWSRLIYVARRQGLGQAVNDLLASLNPENMKSHYARRVVRNLREIEQATGLDLFLIAAVRSGRQAELAGLLSSRLLTSGQMLGWLAGHTGHGQGELFAVAGGANPALPDLPHWYDLTGPFQALGHGPGSVLRYRREHKPDELWIWTDGEHSGLRENFELAMTIIRNGHLPLVMPKVLAGDSQARYALLEPVKTDWFEVEIADGSSYRITRDVQGPGRDSFLTQVEQLRQNPVLLQLLKTISPDGIVRWGATGDGRVGFVLPGH